MQNSETVEPGGNQTTIDWKGAGYVQLIDAMTPTNHLGFEHSPKFNDDLTMRLIQSIKPSSSD